MAVNMLWKIVYEQVMCHKFLIMKLIHLIFLLGIIFPTLTHGQLSLGLKAYYPFGGDPTDQSGNGNNGLLIGNPILTSDRFGTSQCAYYFPGTSSDYIKINYSADFNIDPDSSLSISLWYQGGTENEGDIEVLFEKHNPSVSPYPSDYNIVLYDLNQPGLGSNYALIVASLNSPPIPDPNWHHVIGIYENKNWYFYENNILREEDTSMQYPIFQSTGDIIIGKNFEGSIDDIRFYNRKLSVSEINEIFHLSSSCVTTSTNENISNTINIYPNPASHLIHITIEDNVSIHNIVVYNILGKLILSKINCNTTTEKLDVINWPNGLYCFQIQTDKGVFTAKVEKQE
jgi:hypothetical protein